MSRGTRAERIQTAAYGAVSALVWAAVFADVGVAFLAILNASRMLRAK